VSTKPYDPKDFYYRKAKKEGLRARSAYKIEEIADRFSLLKPGTKVLDLGAAPGGWLQVMAERVGPKGRVIGVDIVEIRPIAKPWVKVAVLDILAPDFRERLAEIEKGPFDLVTSDMAPKTSGIKEHDEARSLELAAMALDTAVALLPPGGNFVCKVFMGTGFDELLARVKKHFERTKVVRPEATRARSFENYVVGLSLRKKQEPKQEQKA
jgi:23S rRNA (uridine2552-2'-O)-methyltransferase